MDGSRLKRSRFRAWRRGFREADLILGPFADAHVRYFSPEKLACFERLLEESDHDLYAWVTGTKPTPPEFDDEVMAALVAFCASGEAAAVR
jgi:antitoxin CptB